MRCNFAEWPRMEPSIWFDQVGKDLLISNQWWLCLRRIYRLLILDV